jgi:hypothetical protein
MLLGCYWSARRPMLKSNKKEHDVEEDPPGDSDDEWLDTALATAESTALATAGPDEGQAPPPPTDDEDVILQARQSPDHAKGTAARETDSPAVTQLMRITARAEGAVMDGWIRIIEDRLDASPATLRFRSSVQDKCCQCQLRATRPSPSRRV